MDTSTFQTISLSVRHRAVIVRVSEHSELLTDEQIRAAQYAILEAVKKHQSPPFLLINLKKLQTVVSPETQEWIATEIIPQLLSLRMRGIAYVMPQEVIEEISIEQVTEEVGNRIKEEDSSTLINYFAEEEQGLQWFLDNQ